MNFVRSLLFFGFTVGLGRAYIVEGPLNDAFEPGPTTMLTLTCKASDAPPNVRVSWYESVTNPGTWSPVSDNGVIIASHPNAARYSIVLNSDTTQFDLVISPTVMADGGAYRCADVLNGSSPALGAQIVTIQSTPNCTSNVPPSGYVVEDRYYSIQCETFYRGNVAPTMKWTGPPPYLEASVPSNISVTSGVAFNASRIQGGYGFSLLTNFTENGFIQPNYASNIPTWSDQQNSPSLIVQWGPKDMYIVPVQATYDVGTTIYCYADANPSSYIFWFNMDTNDRIDDNRIYCGDNLIGTQRMRCNAANNISEGLRTADYFLNLTVNPRPTTPVPTTTVTTTPVPDVASCDDLTGRWRATSPFVIDMCLEVDNSNFGRVLGIMRNATDSYYIEIRGRIAPYAYDQIGLTGIWPSAIGAVTMIGTCRKCMGVEYLQLNGLSRSITDNNGCSDLGSTRYAAMYNFARIGPPCRNPLEMVSQVS